MTVQVRSSGWAPYASSTDLWPGIGVCVLVNGRQIAIFRIGDALYALDNFDPASGANVLSRGIVGDLRVSASSPRRSTSTTTACVTGRCLEDSAKSVNVYPARVARWTRVGERRAAAAGRTRQAAASHCHWQRHGGHADGGGASRAGPGSL